jgi:hypothetical protein
VIGISLGVCLAIRDHATNRPSFGSWRGTPPGDFIKTYLHPVTDWQAALHELLSVLADTVIDPTVNLSAHVPAQEWGLAQSIIANRFASRPHTKLLQTVARQTAPADPHRGPDQHHFGIYSPSEWVKDSFLTGRS